MMVWLANFFVSLVGSVVGYFGQSLAKKTLFATAAIAAFLALTTAFVLVVKALLVGIVYVLPPWAASVAGLMLPSNFSVCISALISARVARWIYEYHVETLKLISYIT